MSFVSRMYNSKKAQPDKTESNKNPNRVAGGLRAQGVDTLTILGEDGRERQIPSQRYVQSIEEQVKKQRAAIDVLERKLARTESNLEKVTATLTTLSRS